MYNITADPCEYFELSTAFPQIYEEMQSAIKVFQSSAVLNWIGNGCDPVLVNVSMITGLAVNKSIKADGGWGTKDGDGEDDIIMLAWQPCDSPLVIQQEILV
jgi:hypothetical protein